MIRLFHRFPLSSLGFRFAGEKTLGYTSFLLVGKGILLDKTIN